jgi:hypothetical protein
MARPHEPEQALWSFVHEVRRAVAEGERGLRSPPYASGNFLVSARAGDVELTIKDVSEEDAVLIAAEIRLLGTRATIFASTTCPSCGLRVPQQRHCTACRQTLPQPAHAKI